MRYHPFRPNSTDKIIFEEIFKEDVYRLKDLAWNYRPVILDIGANVGYFTLACCDFFDAHVYALEPEPSNAEQFLANINLNPEFDINFLEAALWSQDCQLEISCQFGGSSLFHHSTKDNIALVQAVSVDTLFSDFWVPYQIDLMKMDVEGAEYEILKTLNPEMMSRVNVFIIEFHNTTSTNYGQLMSKLSITHHVSNAFGSFSTGGMIYAHRYPV